MKIIITSFALVYAATSTVSADSDTCNNLNYAYPNDIPWVDYQGDESTTLYALTLRVESLSMAPSKAFTPQSTKLEEDAVPCVSKDLV